MTTADLRSGPDWLAARLWDGLAERAHALVVDHDRRHDDVRRVTRDLFHALFVASPRPWHDPEDPADRADAAGPEDTSAYARRLRSLIDSAQFSALHTVTVGDEEAVLQWLPAVVGSFCANTAESDTAQGRANPLGGESGGRRVEGSGNEAPLATDARLTSRTGPVGEAGPGGAEATGAAGIEPAVLAGLVDAATRQELRDLIDACRSGIRRHTGVDGHTDRGGCRSTRTTRDLTRVRTETWHHLATADGETLLWNRWSRAGLPARPEPARRRPGPLLLLVDESGSMELLLDRRNSRRTWSKALVLACLASCAEQQRDLVYVGYSSTDQLWTRRLPPAGTHSADVAEVCAHFFGGDTDLVAPLQHTMSLLDAEPEAPDGGSDVLLLSDGDCLLDDPGLAVAWDETLRRTRSRCWGIRIGERDDPGSTSVLDDLCHTSCDLEEFGEHALADRFRLLEERRTGRA